MKLRETNAAVVKSIPADDQFQPTLSLGKDMSWLGILFGTVPKGTNFLLSGDPGVGKSTLLQQVALSSASCGEQILYITTEQAAKAVENRLKVLGSHFSGAAASRASKNMVIIDDLMDLSLLPTLLSRHVFGVSGKFNGTTVIAIDSLHGSGASAGDRKYWNAIYQYFRQSAAAGITTLALAHVTKDNRIAGPRTLEHQVDVTMQLRPGVSCRTLYLPKNRNGASRTEAYPLTTCPITTRIVPSTLSTSSSASVLTIGEEGVIPMEVFISLPKYERGFVKACGLSAQDVDAVISVLESSVREAHAIRNYGVIVRGPAAVGYKRDQNLAISLAALSAATRKEIDPSTIAVGDLTMRGAVTSPSPVTLNILDGIFAAGGIPDSTRILTGPGIVSSHPLRSHITEVVSLAEAWERSQE